MDTKKGLISHGLALSLVFLWYPGGNAIAGAADEARQQQQLGELANIQYEMAKSMGHYFNHLGKPGEAEAAQGMAQAEQKMVNLVHQRHDEVLKQFYGKVYRLDGAVIDQKEFDKNPEKFLAENGEYDPDADLAYQGAGGQTVQKHASAGPITTDEVGSSGGIAPIAPEARPEISVDGANVPKVLEFPGKVSARKRVPASR